MNEDPTTQFAIRLNQALDSIGFPVKGKGRQDELGKKLGVSQKGARKWLVGEAMPTEKHRHALVNLCHVNYEWLFGGRGPKKSGADLNSEIYRPELLTKTTNEHEADLVDLGPSFSPRMVPVVGMAQLGDNGFYEELGFPPGDGDGFIQAVTKDVNAYALKVRGNSMHPAIRDGWIVMVEPNSEPQVGEFAVVQCANGRKMVKEFLGWRGDELILQSVNEDHGRLTLHRSEVRAIHAVGGIHPPSKREMR